MSSVLNVFVEKLKRNRAVTCAVAVIIVAGLALASYFYNNGKIDAGYETWATTDLSALTDSQKELSISGNHVIKGNPRRVYEDIHLTITNNSVIILENVRVRLTDDQPFISCSGTGTNLKYKIIVMGDCIIESTVEGARMPIISLEGYEIKGTKGDPILGNSYQYYSSSKILTITDEFEDENYNSNLTLINAKDSVSAVIGTVGAELVTPPGSANGWQYEYIYYGCGDVHIEDSIKLNIINRGIGAGIGGGGIVDGGETEALGGGKTYISGGTTRIILPESAYGTAIGGGSALRNENGTFEPSNVGAAGAGPDLVVTGGSLFIENKGKGMDIGTGLGIVDDLVYAGTISDGIGNPITMYIADIDADEATMPTGAFDVYDEVNDNYGKFDLKKVLGTEKYQYEVKFAQYDETTGKRGTIRIETLTTAETTYKYSGVGYQSEIYDISGSLIQTADLTGKLYLWVPSVPAKLYDVELDGYSAQTSSMNAYCDGELVTAARNGSRVKIEIIPKENYSVSEAYYMKSGSPKEYQFEEINGEYYFDMPEGDVTIYVETVPAEFTITYMNDMGATNKNPTSYTASDRIVLKNLSLTGKTFLGWEDAEGNPVTVIEKGTTGDIVLYAKWEGLVYTVSFYNYDGSLILSQVTDYGGTVTPPADPVRDGFTFVKWDKDFSYVTSDMMIMAVYKENEKPTEPEPEPEPEPEEHTVSIDSQIANGSITADIKSGFAGDQVTLTIKSDAGYKLDYIKVVKNDGSSVDVSRFENIGNTSLDGKYTYLFTMPDTDVLVCAEFEIAAYTITYVNVGNNDHNNPTSYNMTDSFVLNNPTKDGVKFLGWEDADGNAVTEIKEGTTGNLVLVGKWEEFIVSDKLKIHINRGIKNGTIISSHKTADKDELITITATPDEGYILKAVKYILAGDLSSEQVVKEFTPNDKNEISFYMPDEDIIVTAVFEPEVYNLIYVDVDESNNPSQYTPGDEFEFAIPVKEGYKFESWYDVNGNKITGIEKGSTGNKIIIATWTKIQTVPSLYSIKVYDGITNGVVYVDRETALEGDKVNVSVMASDGYELKLLEFIPEAVIDIPLPTLAANDNLYFSGTNQFSRLALTANVVTNNNYVFIMPASNIVVKASFALKEDNDETTKKPETPTTDKKEEETTTPEEITGKQEDETTDDALEPSSSEKDTTNKPTVGNGEHQTTKPEKETTTEEPTAGAPDDENPGDVGSSGNITTGDNSKPVMYIMVALFALIAMLAAFLYKEKEENEQV